MCRGCPVRQECLLYGIDAHDRSGPSIWGGVRFPDEYRKLKRLEALARAQAA